MAWAPSFFFFFGGGTPVLRASPNNIVTEARCLEIIEGESLVFGFDFTDKLATGDSVDANIDPVWTCVAVIGDDPNAAACLVGSQQLDDNITLHRIENCIGGVTYAVVATVITSFGDTLKLWFDLKCTKPGCLEC